ncbi:hypothetical protein EVG20_g11094 [Dentipellis fragilis]|uniref:mRNA decay factor PAT1 domain-containing protein n=1 Tax=Dentipellis fragilis TaxID=205917 RepID=A0A4Y9XPV5_9AGAM|nr:hypothetical protein EVG20_g11094 [Dentipellis fragilis]
MSFFGFEQNDLLEREKQQFLEGKEKEDLAVYTWGEESYDGLGDALQEGGDELNDETFGGTGAVGKDFDFAQTGLSPDGHPKSTPPIPETSRDAALQGRARHEQGGAAALLGQPSPQAHSLWDEKSPFSVLPRMNGVRTPVEHARPGSARIPSHIGNGALPPVGQMRASPGLPTAQSLGAGINQRGVRTVEEIEAEMRAAAQQSRSAAVASQRQQLLQEQLLQEQQQQLYQQQQQQQQQLQQQSRAPPPRMHPQSQSPRFHQQQQQQQLLLQQQQHQQQLREQREQELRERQLQQELQLQEAVRMEELERQLRAQRLSEMQRQQQYEQQQQQLLREQYLHQRQASNQVLAEVQALSQLGQRRQRSPMIDPHLQLHSPYQQNGQILPQNIQLQQRLLSELAQQEFLQNISATSQEEQEALRAEAMRRIMETERMEEKRRRKAAKIAHMSRYNDLMTQSDKDFITRIQVSQLVTQDPYAEDFYAQVYGAILRSRLGLQAPDERVLKFGSGGGVGLGLAQKGAGRRPNAMQKMEQQVERIVQNARLREKEKGMHCWCSSLCDIGCILKVRTASHSLQGALGKTSGRSYKAAPRQLLQVNSGSANGSGSPVLGHAHISQEDVIRKHGEGAAKEAAKMGAEALGAVDPNSIVRKEPLTSKETLFILEHLYDLVLNIEQLRREQPPSDSEDFEAVGIWNAQYGEQVQQLWDGLRVMVPLETRSVVSDTYILELIPASLQRPSSIHLPHHSYEGQEASAADSTALELPTDAYNVDATRRMFFSDGRRHPCTNS